VAQLERDECLSRTAPNIEHRVTPWGYRRHNPSAITGRLCDTEFGEMPIRHNVFLHTSETTHT
jgi:hypothetical protein